MESKLKKIDILLISEALDPKEALNFVSSDHCGGINIFVGTVRNHTKGKSVLRLEFEAYNPMAIKEMEKIAKITLAKYDIFKIAIHHRVGNLEIGAIPVVIAVGAAHRAAAFQACRFAIDELKQSVPIWKKEFFEDGAVWVAAHP